MIREAQTVEMWQQAAALLMDALRASVGEYK